MRHRLICLTTGSHSTVPNVHHRLLLYRRWSVANQQSCVVAMPVGELPPAASHPFLEQCTPTSMPSSCPCLGRVLHLGWVPASAPGSRSHARAWVPRRVKSSKPTRVCPMHYPSPDPRAQGIDGNIDSSLSARPCPRVDPCVRDKCPPSIPHV